MWADTSTRYDDIHTEDNLAETSNQDRDEDFLDDFM
jgi:hypothetical protein